MPAIRTGHLSVTGNFRENNEDSCHVDARQRLFIVADGMGGQSAGEKASAMAVELIPRYLEQRLDFQAATPAAVRDVLDRAISSANTEIIALSEVDPSARSMGTTVVLLLRVGDVFYAVGVGDSRCYELRGGVLRQLTTDHSITQALLDSGTISPEEAKTHRYKNVLYKYLGCRDGASGASVVELSPRSGDRFLLCSDGLNDGLKDSEIARLLKAASDPQKACETLVAAALSAGSRDNVSCIAVFVD
ncbi:MAG TPA: serine/threonine-protein phosphatase [Planctomycetaceae bacterium]|jgi:protein phosphatase|nr:serine/threonine-protein phosphatase [Planctomycetaceae bacterium]HBC60744.1 serine/threonine-protein phosphatase [Planctomycetaceae bacterium]